MAGCGPCSPKRSEPPAARRLDGGPRRPHRGDTRPEKALDNGLPGLICYSRATRRPALRGFSTLIPSGHNEGARVQVLVRDNNVDQALKALKKKMQREGIFREMKLRGHYEKPSEKEGAREGGSDPPGPQARAQEDAARRPAADEAACGSRCRWRGRPGGARRRRRASFRLIRRPHAAADFVRSMARASCARAIVFAGGGAFIWRRMFAAIADIVNADQRPSCVRCIEPAFAAPALRIAPVFALALARLLEPDRQISARAGE